MIPTGLLLAVSLQVGCLQAELLGDVVDRCSTDRKLTGMRGFPACRGAPTSHGVVGAPTDISSGQAR
jgi:hypothetical protein